MNSDIYWGLSHHEFYAAVKQFATLATKDDHYWNEYGVCTSPLKQKVHTMMKAFLSVYATRKTKSTNGDLTRKGHRPRSNTGIHAPSIFEEPVVGGGYCAWRDQQHQHITLDQAGRWIKKVLPLPV